MKSALILGMGVSGKAAFHFLEQKGVSVVGVDLSPEEGEIMNLDPFDTLVVSPGVPLSHPLICLGQKKGINIIGEMELGARYLRNRAIGITGTNGKTTVTMLSAHALNFSGIKASPLGNSGQPLTSAQDNLAPDAIAVLELSSYQLELLSTPCLDAAIILNLSPDHLDRYADMDAYLQAKLRIQGVLKTKATKLFVSSSLSWVPHSQGYEEKEEFFSDLSVTDAKNAAAAFSIVEPFGVTLDVFKNSLSTFSKPAHRLQWVRCVQGVTFIDDSKGTNTHATVAAILSRKEPIHLIAGGVDKGGGYEVWKEAFKEKCKSIHLIGQAAPLIFEALQEDYNVSQYETLQKAVEQAFLLAKPGETVLLSPGCASFDMFQDYAQRGDCFKAIVGRL